MMGRSSKSSSLSSSLLGIDFWNLCTQNVRSIQDLANGGTLLNKRQCLDLSSKLSDTIQNIQELLLHCRAHVVLFRPALENLHRYLEKAKMLMEQCSEKDWCRASVFQSQNQSAFREILLDVSLCYNAIFEQGKSARENWHGHPEDLRQSSMFLPATANDVYEDQQDLQRRLEDLAKKPSSTLRSEKAALMQCLARYMLVKLKCTSEQSQINTLDTCSTIFWAKETEPSGTWGNYKFLAAGAGSNGVCSTTWLGVPCAKKEFHGDAFESFFLKEAGILAHLKHPCIVNFICCGNGKEEGDRFIAMELMEKSLSELIEEQRDMYFSLPVVVDMILQIARGMCYLHEEGVAHCDLRPANVVVSRLINSNVADYFCVKLIDFGLSKTKFEFSELNTISGLGTTIYRAPEIHPKAHPNGKGLANWLRADAYSFAITCAHVLSLKIPFGDIPMPKLHNELINGLRPELSSNCPQELVALLRDCWNTNPSLRPPFVEICTRLEIFRHKHIRDSDI
jgi:serine/threonine protein kinase